MVQYIHLLGILDYKALQQFLGNIKENNEDLDLDEEDEPEVYLNSIDPKIPPQCLFRFYGGFKF